MTQLTPDVSQKDHIQGNPDAPVTLVEYGDFECPACGKIHAIVQQIQKDMGEEMRFVFRHFPSSNTHHYAMDAAVFAEQAGLQNDFWQAHDWLLTHQDSLDPASLDELVRVSHLEPDKMKRDQNEARIRVGADIANGQQSGVEGTPTFFINGDLFDDSWDAPNLLAAVRAAFHTTKLQHSAR